MVVRKVQMALLELWSDYMLYVLFKLGVKQKMFRLMQLAEEKEFSA